MNSLSDNNYIDTLHQQISKSVDTIKKRSSAKTETIKNVFEQPLVSENFRLNGGSYRLLSASTAYQLVGEYDSRVETGYVTDSYRYAAEVIKEPTVLIDFMFENNREFDFKV